MTLHLTTHHHMNESHSHQHLHKVWQLFNSSYIWIYGCGWWTILSQLKSFSFVSHSYVNVLVASYPRLSKDSFSHSLHLLYTFILPQNNNLPSLYASAYSSVKHLLVQPQEFHACVNDCILFHNEYKDLQSCPKCGSSRYSVETQVP